MYLFWPTYYKQYLVMYMYNIILVLHLAHEYTCMHDCFSLMIFDYITRSK